MTDWPFDPLTPGKYGVILCDPPWNFKVWSGVSDKSAAGKYDVMNLEGLTRLPVADLAAPDCMMIMWAVQAMLPEALDLMNRWGFRYKTAGSWAKQSSTGNKWAFGTGYIMRCAAEFYIVGTRGKPKSAVKNIRNLIVAPVREHSRKPDDLHTSLERMFPKADKCELFARESRPGWSTWGNQSTKFDDEWLAA